MADLGEEAFSSQMKVVATFLRLLEELMRNKQQDLRYGTKTQRRGILGRMKDFVGGIFKKVYDGTFGRLSRNGKDYGQLDLNDPAVAKLFADTMKQMGMDAMHEDNNLLFSTSDVAKILAFSKMVEQALGKKIEHENDTPEKEQSQEHGQDQERQADASLRKFNIILCKNQSRFTRDMQLVEKYIHGLFPIWGIRFVGMVDGADTSVKGNKKARQINGLVNQWYLENLSDNIKATLKLKRIRGKYTGSVLPYGYRPDPDDINCFIIDPVAASVVRRIWEMHAGGIGAPTIARTLNEEGIPNPTSYAKLTGYSWHNRPSSSLWSAGCIYSILHNETYLGTLCQGRQLTPEGQFHSKKNIPKDQWVRTVGHHPAIIDDELLRRELKARKEAGAHNLHEQKKNFPPGIFGKEVRCASYGKILTKGKTLRKTGYERTLFCPTRKKSPSHCKGAFISEKHLESAILHELKNLAERYSDDRVQIGICQDAQSADLIQERNRLKTAVELIEKEITAYEQRSRDLYLKRATDGMSIDDFNSALSRIRNDVDKLRLKSKRASSELLHLNESIAAESIRMETVLKAADFNHLDKTKVSMLIESVYVHKRDPKSGTQAIDITWKF